MRGKVEKASRCVQRHRITPAYAGKSHVFNKCRINNWDHPRLCGEKCEKSWEGKEMNRITPAYAGKSPRIPFFPLYTWDHPRLCGEKGRLRILV